MLFKDAYDQRKLFIAHKAEIDPAFQIPPIGIMRRASTINKLIQIIFGKYPKQPNVNRLAKKVRQDLAATVILFVLIILVSIILWG